MMANPMIGATCLVKALDLLASIRVQRTPKRKEAGIGKLRSRLPFAGDGSLRHPCAVGLAGLTSQPPHRFGPARRLGRGAEPVTLTPLISVPHSGLTVPPEAKPYCMRTRRQIVEGGDGGAAEV
jgi:hypothetical protein